MDRHLPSQRGKNIVTNAAAVVFLIVGSLHLVRGIMQLPATVGNWDVPLWVSWLAAIAAVYLSWLLFRMDKAN